MSKSIKWTEEEITYLKENYTDVDILDIIEHLKRSRQAIIHKASKLGIRKMAPYKVWSIEEEQILKENYKTTRIKELADIFNTTTGSIRHKASSLGLSDSQIVWTKEKKQYLKENYNGDNAKELSKKLKVSTMSIYTQASKMGITAPHEFKSVDYYINLYNESCKKEDRLIPIRKIREYGLPDYRWFLNNDSSIKNTTDFYRRAGFIPNRDITKEEVDRGIQYMVSKYGKDISYDEFREPKLNEVAIHWICKYYGTMNKMKEEFGLVVNQEDMVSKTVTNEEILSEVKELAEKLGKTPTGREVGKHCSFSSSTASKQFGTFNNLLIECGFETNKDLIAREMSDEELKTAYISYIDKMGYVPSYATVAQNKDLPSPNTAMRRFDCTYVEFIQSLGYDYDKKAYGTKLFAKDGTKCLSFYERDIHNTMLDIGINIVDKELKYRDFLKKTNYVGHKRCDWVLENNGVIYIMEYFGIMTNADYRESHDFKLELIKKDTEKDYVFIAMYQDDITKVGIRKFLENKILANNL